MFGATYSPILRSTLWLYIQLLVQCTDTAADLCHGWDGLPSQPVHRSAAVSVHCTRSCIYSQKAPLRMGESVARTCRAELKRLINEKVVVSCWLFILLYWVTFHHIPEERSPVNCTHSAITVIWKLCLLFIHCHFLQLHVRSHHLSFARSGAILKTAWNMNWTLMDVLSNQNFASHIFSI